MTERKRDQLRGRSKLKEEGIVAIAAIRGVVVWQRFEILQIQASVVVGVDCLAELDGVPVTSTETDVDRP